MKTKISLGTKKSALALTLLLLVGGMAFAQIPEPETCDCSSPCVDCSCDESPCDTCECDADEQDVDAVHADCGQHHDLHGCCHTETAED